jgi:DNA-3-methyladenine glycosylase
MSGLELDSLQPVPAAFFARPTEAVARELLGKILVSRVGDGECAGRIVEVEAYLGAHDPGSHAATRGITQRNRVMYGPPGHAYVYFTYGMHHMLNLVTEPEGVAGAVLIRAIEPIAGTDTMVRRRGGRRGVELTNGPAKVAEALGVTLELNGSGLGDRLVVCDAPRPRERVLTSGRVGLAAGHDLPLRFYLEGNAYVSRARTGPKPRSARRRAVEQRETR